MNSKNIVRPEAEELPSHAPNTDSLNDQPKRVQLKRTKGWRMPPNTVKVDRTTQWGNRYRAIGGVTPDQVVAAFRKNLMHEHSAWLRERVRAHLGGKNLACWCRPGSPCHADVLLEIANAPSSEETPTSPPNGEGKPKALPTEPITEKEGN